jgi:hypothetical protein
VAEGLLVRSLSGNGNRPSDVPSIAVLDLASICISFQKGKREQPGTQFTS